MFKLEHDEAVMLLQIIEANSFSGKDIPAIAKLITKLQREAVKTAPAGTTTEDWIE